MSYIADGQCSYRIEVPVPSKWVCHIFKDYHYRPIAGNEPNWFWRWTQYLVFGFKWVKDA